MNKIFYMKIYIKGFNYYIAKNSENLVVYLSTRNEKLDDLEKTFKSYELIEVNNCFENERIELIKYFNKEGELNFPIKLIGTNFQVSVWKELENIKYGETVSYLEISKRLGDSKKVRAVANAIGKNPIAIRIPCHRVIGSDGKLHGYSGGIDMKIDLLELEKK